MQHVQKVRSLLERELVVYDVGARWGISESWAPLEESIQVFGFDPDPEECARLNAASPSNVRYVAAALGAEQQLASLHITAEPACSSVFKPRVVLADRVPVLAAIHLEDKIDIELIDLDSWIATSGEPSPDVLKLDTQGGELDILTGAEKALDTVELIEIEVEFNPIYEGQPLFSDVDSFLRTRGFELWRLSPLVHYSCEDTDPTLGQRDSFELEVSFDGRLSHSHKGNGQLFWADAFYVREDLGICGAATLPEKRAAIVAAGALGLGLGDLARLALSRAQ